MMIVKFTEEQYASTYVALKAAERSYSRDFANAWENGSTEDVEFWEKEEKTVMELIKLFYP